MPARSCARLLVASALILLAARLGAQARQVDDRSAATTRNESKFVIQSGSEKPSPTAPFRLHLPITGSMPEPSGFGQVARAAGEIFSGTVTAIARRPASSSQPIETVAITFHVENAIRGTTPGSELTISQWIGLWAAGQRYALGERVLLFLYPPSKLGLTSCVAGAMGRFRLDPESRVLLTEQHLVSFRADPVLGGKARVPLSDFVLAVQRASEEE